MRRSVKIPASGQASRTDANNLKVTVYYDLGGICYNTYRIKPRGYYLSVLPVKVTPPSDGLYGSESFSAFTGTSYLLEETKRASKKRFDALCEEAIKQIRAKEGRAWDALQAKAVEFDMTFNFDEADVAAAA